jgi:hypothetical protein
MGIANKRFRMGDVFIDYDYENVMFRWEHATGKCFRKFYGENQEDEDEVPHDNGLLNEAIRFGDETDAQTYYAGKPALRAK